MSLYIPSWETRFKNIPLRAKVCKSSQNVCSWSECLCGVDDSTVVFTTEFVMSVVKQTEHKQILFKQHSRLVQEQFMCSLIFVNDDR